MAGDVCVLDGDVLSSPDGAGGRYLEEGAERQLLRFPPRPLQRGVPVLGTLALRDA